MIALVWISYPLRLLSLADLREELSEDTGERLARAGTLPLGPVLVSPAMGTDPGWSANAQNSGEQSIQIVDLTEFSELVTEASAPSQETGNANSVMAPVVARKSLAQRAGSVKLPGITPWRSTARPMTQPLRSRHADAPLPERATTDALWPARIPAAADPEVMEAADLDAPISPAASAPDRGATTVLTGTLRARNLAIGAALLLCVALAGKTYQVLQTPPAASPALAQAAGDTTGGLPSDLSQRSTLTLPEPAPRLEDPHSPSLAATGVLLPASSQSPVQAQSPTEDLFSELLDRWDSAGLVAAAFADTADRRDRRATCRAGTVSDLEVVVCQHATQRRARLRSRQLRNKIARSTSTFVGPYRLLVVDRDRSDPKRERRRKVASVFRTLATNSVARR